MPGKQAAKARAHAPTASGMSSPSPEAGHRLLDADEVAYLEKRAAAQMQAEQQAEEERAR